MTNVKPDLKPKKIYLQIPEDWDGKPSEDITWSDDKVFDNDVCYIRAGNSRPPEKGLREINKEGVVALLTAIKWKTITKKNIPFIADLFFETFGTRLSQELDENKVRDVLFDCAYEKRIALSDEQCLILSKTICQTFAQSKQDYIPLSHDEILECIATVTGLRIGETELKIATAICQHFGTRPVANGEPIDPSNPYSPHKSWNQPGYQPVGDWEKEFGDSKFYELMQAYRNAPLNNQAGVCKVYDDIIYFIRSHLRPIMTEEIEALKKEYATQDNRITAFPIYVTVQELFCVGVIADGYSACCPYGDDETKTEFRHPMLEGNFNSKPELIKALKDDGWQGSENEISEIEELTVGYIWVDREFFLTIKGAEEYMKANAHNHGKLRNYVHHFERKNFEMRKLLKNLGFKTR